MPKNRLSKIQQRKSRLSQQSHMTSPVDSRTMTRSNFKTDELAPLWLACETAIYQCFVVTDRRLLDSAVYAAVEEVIAQIETNTPPPAREDDAIHYTVGEEKDVVVEVLHMSLDGCDHDYGPFAINDVLGVLRSILQMIELKRTPAPQSQAYIRYVVGFLKRNVGIRIHREATGA